MKKPIVTDILFLRKKSLPIETLDEAKSILQDLEDSLDIKKGCGLAAPQIGVLKRISLIKIGTKKIVLMNPEIVEKQNPVRVPGEGCLSIPGIHLDTKRYSFIRVENYDIETGEASTQIYSGLEAIAIQHETDHLNGITMLERKWKAR